MNAEDVLAKIIDEANERLVEETAPQDLRWAVACYTAERMLVLANEGMFSPVELLERYLHGVLRDFPGGVEDTARGCAMNAIATSLLGLTDILAEGRAACQEGDDAR